MCMMNLNCVKEFVERNTNVKCEIKNIWKDFGTGETVKTLVSISPEEYILLSPAEIKKAGNGFIPKERVKEIVNEINRRGW